MYGIAQPLSRPDTAPSHLPPSGFLSCQFLFEGFFSYPSSQQIAHIHDPAALPSAGPAPTAPILRSCIPPATRAPPHAVPVRFCADRSRPTPASPAPATPCAAGSRHACAADSPRCSSSPARSAPPPLAPCPSCSSPRLKPWILPQFWLGKRVIWRNSNLNTDWPSDSVYFCDDELNTDLKKFSFSIKLFRWALLSFPHCFLLFLVNFPHPQIISTSYWLVSLCEMWGLILVPTHVSDQRARGNERPQPQPALIWIQPVEHPMLSCWAPAPSLPLSFLLF